jgi:class 3 adenylate cyclase/pimeloyl-ACP methyl ester carboxylesterase
MERSEIRYAVTGDHHIAFRVLTGDVDGGHDIVMVNGGHFPMDSLEGDPLANRMVEGLAALGCLVMFDRRGIGLSDPIIDWDRSLVDQWAEDLAAVIDASGVERPTVFSWQGQPVARHFAVRHPTTIDQLVLFNPFVPLEPWELDRAALEAYDKALLEGPDQSARSWPNRWHDPVFREWQDAAGRAGASPSQAARLHEARRRMGSVDTSQVSVATLVLARRPPTMPLALPDDYFGRAADRIPGAALVWLPDGDTFPFGVGVDDVLAEISRFVTGRVRLPEPERILTTILFTDLVDSTRLAVTVGDRGWKALLDRHDQLSRALVHRHGGEVVKTTGDGILALFPSTNGAIEAARDIARELAADDLPVRVGVHAGQVDRRGEDVSGLAIHVAARIMSEGGPGRIVVSEIVERVTDDFSFEPIGDRELKGLEGRWPLYELQ